MSPRQYHRSQTQTIALLSTTIATTMECAVTLVDSSMIQCPINQLHCSPLYTSSQVIYNKRWA